MKQGLKIEYDWKLIGAELANEDGEKQADFFRGFVKECLSWGTRYQAEFQLAGVNRLLTDEEKELLSMIGYKEGGGK